jgi:hypothetical protein
MQIKGVIEVVQVKAQSSHEVISELQVRQQAIPRDMTSCNQEGTC